VEKCAAYAGPGGVVTREVADEVCAFVAEASAWTLTDALVARDRDTALSTLHRLLEDGEPSHKLLGTVVWQLRQVLLVQDAARRALPDREAGVRMPPHKLRAVKDMVSRRPLSPSAVLEEVAAVNRAMNSSRAGDRRTLEAFVLRLLGL
jgi:DNA polymerase III delta subunit